MGDAPRTTCADVVLVHADLFREKGFEAGFWFYWIMLSVRRSRGRVGIRVVEAPGQQRCAVERFRLLRGHDMTFILPNASTSLNGVVAEGPLQKLRDQ